MVFLLSGLFGCLIILQFIRAVMLSYRIEARSRSDKARGRVGYTNVFAVALGVGVATDDETTAMRHRLIIYLGLILLEFAAMAILIAVFTDPPAAG